MRQLRIMLVACATLAALALAFGADAQNSGDTQRKLDKVKRELKDVAAERRKLEGSRGKASIQLRRADEQLGASSRSLRETEAALAQEQAQLVELQQRRDALQSTLQSQRNELATLLRAAYTIGTDAPLKLMLAQDRVADASRVLTWHGYLQRQRAQRISVLTAELSELERLEDEIAQKRFALDTTRQTQQAQLEKLQGDRSAHARTVAQLDERFQDRKAREKALGRDAKSLERLLTQLRAAARRAEAERKAAAARAAAKPGTGTTTRPDPPMVANAAPIRVGGLGWPLSGNLLAGYGGTLPDGRKSSGLLIAAPAGSQVKAVANGKVVFAEWMNGYGLILIIDHGNQYMSLYAHNEALLRDAGDSVQRGDPVGTVGNSGGQGRPALYFELRRNGEPVNPDSWLQKR